MFFKFFIERPILAIVSSIIIILAGIVSIINLPVEQYPNLTPPTVSVRAFYPGAGAEVLSDTVASILEDKLNGVEDMLYMNSVSSNNGSVTVTISFKVGTDPDKALINVNNRVQMATPLLPEPVRRYGVIVQKQSSSMLQVGCFYADSDLYDGPFIGNYASTNIAEHLRRISGIGSADVLTGNMYSMRIWIHPDKLFKYDLTTADVMQAISIQNAQYASGAIGQQPMENVKITKSFPIIVKSRFQSPEQFKNIILRATQDGKILRLSDVADIELGAQSYDIVSSFNGKLCTPIMLSLTPGANALAAAAAVEQKIKELSVNFPKGTHFDISYDTTGFVKYSIKEVVKTIFEAMVLVFLIVFLFLKNIRTTLIPCIAVPVSIIGTFAGMLLCGFSINTLTLFGMVLSIGIVVDDAIIVVENVERIMHLNPKLSVKEATIAAMEEVYSPVIAIVLILCAVFVPVGFTGGLTGVMYKQFAITIAISVIISGFVALSLTPSLCVQLLHTDQKKTNRFFDAFDKVFERITNIYIQAVKYLLHSTTNAMLIFATVITLVVVGFKMLPTSLLPDEDQGIVLTCALLDPASSLNNAKAICETINKIAKSDPSVMSVTSIAGYDMLSQTPKNSSATLFIKLKHWNDRTKPGMSASDVKMRLMMGGYRIPNSLVFAFTPPPIVGMSTTGGFEGFIQSLGGNTVFELANKATEVAGIAAKCPVLTGVRTTFHANSPVYRAVVNEVKAISMGINIADIYNTLASTFGAYYVNDFSQFGKSFKVMMQAKDIYRAFPEQLSEIYVRSNSSRSMVPLSSLVTLSQSVGPEMIERFNGFPAAKIMGNPAPGYSSGQAIKAFEDSVRETLGDKYSLSWSGSAYQEKTSSGASYTMLLGILVVFLILAALYERWSLPFAVLLAVPFAALGAITTTFLSGHANDIYFQVAIITLIGLSTKNAILIVEFAVALYKNRGIGLMESAVQAAQLRFRPIIMTSLTFILGCLPLVLSSSAGSASRSSLGTSIIGGMIGATLIAPLFIPLFFVLIFKLTNIFKKETTK